MRISTSYIHQQSVEAMLNKQGELANTQQQVSTGSRIISPADDPVASVRILGLERDISLTEQYQRNADIAENKLSLLEGTLTSASDLLQRVRELAVQGLNDTTSDGREGIANEIQELKEALLALANTTNSNGEYLFSGYQSNTQAFDTTSPYAYNGDSGQRNIKVGSDYTVEVNETGNDVFVANTVASTTQTVFETMDQFVAALNGGTVGTAPNNGDFLTNLDSVMDQINLARTRVGTKLNAIDQQRSVNEVTITSLTTQTSALKDLDYAEAITRLNQQSTGLQAAQQAYVKVQGLSLFNYI